MLGEVGLNEQIFSPQTGNDSLVFLYLPVLTHHLRGNRCHVPKIK